MLLVCIAVLSQGLGGFQAFDTDWLEIKQGFAIVQLCLGDPLQSNPLLPGHAVMLLQLLLDFLIPGTNCCRTEQGFAVMQPCQGGFLQ
jgi:hypothetical protein